jgi:hypothetical protein
VYLDKENWSAVPDAECAECGQGLRSRGCCWPPNRCTRSKPQPPFACATGAVSVTDGPFAETKEQLAGFYLIDARDLNDAIQVAAKIPPARKGSVEVRPVRSSIPNPNP